MVILMHSDHDAVTEVRCVVCCDSKSDGDLDAVTEVRCVVCCDSKSDGDLDAQ